MKLVSILDLFRRDDWSNELVESICAMMETGADMFGYAMGVIIRGEPDTNPQERIYGRDRGINERVREIRRRVVARLAIGASKADVPTALIFMNAVKDVERIGDYMKNLYEVAHLMPPGADRAVYREHLGPRAEEIERFFARTLQAFAESDPEVARDVIERTRRFGKQAEVTITELTHGDLPTADTVCLVLAIRFLKRIALHMNNVATTVVVPIDNLDFYDEPGRLG
jgi:phosphate transport system protein